MKRKEKKWNEKKRKEKKEIEKKGKERKRNEKKWKERRRIAEEGRKLGKERRHSHICYYEIKISYPIVSTSRS